jgi:acyl-CoA synthetase (AMP-forming)/AMP-acid ligase II
VSLAGLLLDADGDPDEVIVSAGDDERTRGEIVAQAEAIAADLTGRGVGPGHLVAVSLPSGPDVVAALFGVWRAGATYLPLNPRLSPTERDRILTELHPSVVISGPDPANWASVSSVSDETDAQFAKKSQEWGAEVALVQFTSGTTGRPKAVPLRHTNVLDLLDGVVGSLRGSRGSSGKPNDARPAMPNLIPVSLSLWAGIYNVLFALRVGAPIVVLDPFTTDGFAAVVKRYDIRSTVLPPAAMTMLADDDAVVDLTPLRYVRSITAPLSPLQAQRFHEKFDVAILNCYGQTEIGGEIVGWTATDWRESGDEKLGAVGRPHTGVHVQAVDTDGVALPAGDAGELVVRTPALERDEAMRSELADRMTVDGWFRTGDIGRVDAEGFVWIEGRVSDMINRGGLKVFPDEVAEVLRLAPAVDDAAVVGVPDDRLGEVPVAFLVRPAGAPSLDGDALDALCRAHLAPYKVPIRYLTVDELPRNEIGKVLSRELVERAVAAGAAG